MRKRIINILILFFICVFSINAQNNSSSKNINYLSTLFTVSDYNNNWAGFNSLLSENSKLGLSFNNSIYNKIEQNAKRIKDDSLRLSLLLYTGGETGDPLYFKYTRPSEDIPNKNKIIPSFNLLLSKEKKDFLISAGFDLQGYFLTGTNKMDKLIYQLDPILMDKNNIDIKSEGTIKYRNIFADWEITKNKGWNFLPFIDNLTYSSINKITTGIGFETNFTKNKITFESLSYDIIKPSIKKFNIINYQLLGELKLYKTINTSHLIKYIIGNISSDSKIDYENKKEINKSTYYHIDYCNHFDLGMNIFLNSSIGFMKERMNNEGIKLNLSLNKKIDTSTFTFGASYEPLEYKYENTFFDYQWELNNLIFITENTKISSKNYFKKIYFDFLLNKDDFNLKVAGDYSNINNYYKKEYKIDNSVLVQYYNEVNDKNFARISFEIDYKISDFKIKTGLIKNYSELKEIPKTILFSILNYSNTLGMDINFEYYYYSNTQWNEVFNQYTGIYNYKLHNKNIFNLMFKQNLQKINLKEIDLGLMIYNLFDSNNQYLPLSTSIGRTIVVFINTDFNINL